MRRLWVLFIMGGLIFSACKRGGEDEPAGDGAGGGNGNGGDTPAVVTSDSTVRYYGLDSTFVYSDTTYISSVIDFNWGSQLSDTTFRDTALTTFLQSVSSGDMILVLFRDSLMIQGTSSYDTLIAKYDSLFAKVNIGLDTAALAELRPLIGLNPLRVGLSWQPVPPSKIPVEDTLRVNVDSLSGGFLSGCTLYVYIDTLEVRSTSADVFDSTTISTPGGSFGAFAVHYFYDVYVHYRTQGVNCSSNDDTLAPVAIHDTVYISPGFGTVKRISRTSFSFYVNITTSTTLNIVINNTSYNKREFIRKE